MSTSNTAETTEVAESDESKARSNALRKAYGNATTLLREQFRNEFDTLYSQEAEKLGVTYTPRLTPEQKAEQEMADLLAKFPHLRERIAPTA